MYEHKQIMKFADEVNVRRYSHPFIFDNSIRFFTEDSDSLSIDYLKEKNLVYFMIFDLF